jgi:predicted alpha/beta-fold hydrolase
MGGNLQNLLRKHIESLTGDPTHHVAIAAKTAVGLNKPTLEDFDQEFTRIAGGPPPHFPFPSSEDYYVWASSDKMIPDITVPFLSLNADDDPVVKHVPMHGGENGFVTMVLTKGGGHLGWFQAGDGFVDRWTTRPILEWLKLMGEDLAAPTTTTTQESKAPPKLFVDEEGWLREEGRPHLGCKELSETIVEGINGESGILQGL